MENMESTKATRQAVAEELIRHLRLVHRNGVAVYTLYQAQLEHDRHQHRTHKRDDYSVPA